MTRTVAADAVMPACLGVAAACPDAASAVSAAIAIAGPDPAARRPWPRRPTATPPSTRRAASAEPRLMRPLHRHSVPSSAVTLAGWPADPGRDV